jgi:hypothetical protein
LQHGCNVNLGIFKVETKNITFKYSQLDSDKLAAELNQNGVVEVLLSPKQAKLIIKVIDVVHKIDQASVTKNTTLKKFDFYKTMFTNFWIMIFHSKLIEIVTFYTLEKPKYLLDNQKADGWCIRFEAAKVKD